MIIGCGEKVDRKAVMVTGYNMRVKRKWCEWQ